MSVRLGISVEGPTEERFVKDVLDPHLQQHEVYATPIIVTTSRSASGTKTKGGGINMDRVTGELRRILQGYQDGYVTSLYDYYGFGDRRATDTVERLEERIAARLDKPGNLLAYIQLHEFEGLLLSDPAVIASYFGAPSLENVVKSAVANAGNPEAVDLGPSSAPSKRLEGWTRQYSTKGFYSKSTKTLHGPLQTARLTLPVIRSACPRFSAWISRLESLRPRVSPA